MPHPVSVIVPFTPTSAATAIELATALARTGRKVICAGEGLPRSTVPHVTVLGGLRGKGAALRQALAHVTTPLTVIQDADAGFPADAHEALLPPLRGDVADAVFGRRTDGVGWRGLPNRALGALTRWATDLTLQDPLTGLRAVRTEVLKGLSLTSEGDEVGAELVTRLATGLFRLSEIPLARPASARPPLGALLGQTRAALRYALAPPDASEGHAALLRLDGAPNYNAWLGRRFRPHLGRRVLEVGAGIGTVTQEIEAGRELVIALEVEPLYVERLKNRFRGKPHVRPYLSDVKDAAWDDLARERLDSVVVSNVLEHIDDDAGAVRNFRKVLPPSGTLVVFVPALPALMGSLDEAVGHHRRYTAETLRTLLEGNGFSVDILEWMNLVGVPGWFVNGRLFRRRSVPPLQLKLYNALAPAIAAAEAHLSLPLGMSLFAVARAVDESQETDR